MDVEADGSTNDVSFKFVPNLFKKDDDDVYGKFTVELKWYGFEFKSDFKSCRRCEMLLDDYPKDVTVTCCEGVTFMCHSNLLKGRSYSNIHL